MQTNLLEYGVLLAFVISFVSLIFLIQKTFRFGRKALHSEPQGKGLKGIMYAFGRGMLPWEKESADKHLPTYLAGIVYHVGLFSALMFILLRIIHLELGQRILILFQILFGTGILSGLGLLIKRSVIPSMKKISCPDDFLANILVDGLIFLTLVDTIYPGIRPVLYIYTIVLLLYIPIGKIRHCFFFFYSRVLFGIFFGRRGVLGQKHKEIKI
jgi:hypothetical protein